MQRPEVAKPAYPDWCRRLGEGQLGAVVNPGSGLQLAAVTFDESGFRPPDFGHWGVLPPASLYRAARKRQAEFLAGRLCASQALQQLRGTSGFPARDDQGAPVWPEGINGSITHSAGLAMAVVGDNTRFPGIGLDLEVVQNPTEARSLTSLVLTPGEQARYQEALTQDPGLCLTRIFSLKEALFKALFPLTRQRFYFQDAEVCALKPDGHCQLRLLTRLAADWPRGREIGARLTLWRDHVVALVLTSAAHDPTLTG